MKFNKTIERGVLHCHTQYSRFDSAMSVKTLLDTAYALGAPAVMLSDHGTGMGFEETRNIMEKSKGKYGDMKVIYAVEFYVNYEPLGKRTHLIVAAKNLTGYKAIIKLLTKSNHNIDSKGMPIVEFSDLEEFFGKGKEYEGSVVVTSACMGGVVATPLLSNFYLERDIEKMKKKQSSLPSPHSPTYLKKKEKEGEIEKEIEELSEEISYLTTVSKKPYKKKQNALKKLEGDPDYAIMKAALEEEMAETENAILLLPSKKKEREEKKREWRVLRDDNKKLEESHVKFLFLEEEMKKKEEEKKNEDELYEIATNEAKKYYSLFGEDFYIELQNHRIPEEIYVMPLVAKIAKENNLPVIAANDAHMPSNSEDDVKRRQIMRSLRYNKWEAVDESDKELYIKTDDELYSILSEILSEDIVTEAMVNVEDFVAKCNLVHENGFHYPVFKSEIEGETAAMRLRRLSEEGIERRYPGGKGWTNEHRERLEYELAVIHELGYDDYLCIVEDFLTYGRLVGKLSPEEIDEKLTDENKFDFGYLREITKESAGLGIGPGRGSGVGSLVDYLIGITGVDPLKYGLIFERFLNKERVSPPDIDSDVKSDIRDLVIEYIEWKYGGSNAVCGILAKGTQQVKAAIRNAARLLGDELYEDTKTFLDLGDQICKAVPKKLDITFKECEKELREAFAGNEHAQTIITNAVLVEGTFINIGMHAAGVVIADNGDISSYVPLMFAEGKNRFVTQCDKIEVENKNLLKMDVLGLKNLKIITDTLQMIKERTGKVIDMESIDLCDADVYKNIFAAGNTDSIFQFESSGMKNLLRQFKPEKMEHLTLLNALYRPGPIQYIEPILEVKNGKRTPDYVIPEMESVLGETFSFPVYQEQIIKIFNLFAGFSLGESDIIRRAMAKKHLEELVAYKDKFFDGFIKRGATKEKAEKFWDELLEFSKYCFNKSHSCAYSHVAYYTAWLKYHYPREYLSAVMNTTEFDKIGDIIADCKRANIPVRHVDINSSKEMFSVSGDSIVYGMGLVKEIGNSAKAIIEEREINGPFASLIDFILRTNANKTVIENLIYAGAFDGICKNRVAMLSVLPKYLEITKKIKDQKKKLLDANEEKTEKIIEKISNYTDDVRGLRLDISLKEDPKEKLEKEKEITGCYLSAHPLDFYDLENEKFTEITALDKSRKATSVGLISTLRVTNRKSDGAEMAFFTFEDRTGTMEVCCFADDYKKYSDLIKEGNVVKIEGSVSVELKENEAGDVEEVVKKMSAKSVTTVREKVEKVCVQVSSIVDWISRVNNIALMYKEANGLELIVFDASRSEFRKSNIRVAKDILNDKNISGFVTA